ncbi:MAG TPA: hypothetical protein PLP33_24590 [Leptospiraceae bacterium]|nr:hypothetical protein [Leptospiraceae bacterium]
MPKYNVRLVFEGETANSPEEAARQVAEYIKDNTSELVFFVEEEGKPGAFTVDMSELDEE